MKWVMLTIGACDSAMPLMGWRAGRAGRHLVDPYGEPVGTDGRDRQRWHENRCQKEEREDFHALTALSSKRVVATNGHALSRSRDFWNWTASGPLPGARIGKELFPALIWINRGHALDFVSPALTLDPTRNDRGEAS